MSYHFRYDPRSRYIALYKPFGVLCQFSPALDGPADRQTLANFGLPNRVYPVGRLDHDSEGLLLLTDDRFMTTRLFDESRPHPRRYLVQVEGIPTADALDALSVGPVIEGRRCLPCRVIALDYVPDLPPRNPPVRYRASIPTSFLILTLYEGKNRQVRKMTASVGLPTLRLIRISIGGLYLEDLDLEPGQWTDLEAEQVEEIFRV